jgi:hypothetical protein
MIIHIITQNGIDPFKLENHAPVVANLDGVIRF